MTDLIKRSDVLALLTGNDVTGYKPSALREMMERIPTVDALPVVNGMWEYHDCVCTGEGLVAVYACSVCNGCIDEDVFDGLYNAAYCPNCGARMESAQ